MHMCTSEQTDLSLHICIRNQITNSLFSDNSIFSGMTHLGRLIITLGEAVEPLSGKQACAGVSVEAAQA